MLYNKSMALIGAHVSITGGVDRAAARAKAQGCEVMQIFVQSPQAFKTPETSEKEAELFKVSLKTYGIKAVYVHAPYLINLASPNNRIRHGSIAIIQKNLDRASVLGCAYLMAHLGSYGHESHQEGLERLIKSVATILEAYAGSCGLLLEMSAGSGNIIGARFEEIHTILAALHAPSLGVCLDTVHVFASGYDMRNKASVDATIKEFDRIIGLPRLKLIHANDSAMSLGSKKDRHADIGDGFLGRDAFHALLHHPKLQKLNFILETPGSDKRRLKDVKLLKKLRDSA